ncbi:Spore-associated protein A precursor [Actinomadura rubteroloni]|uniref:Spore-associated protein A n=1 Tax=Actinomadura rubteroloni TaxID=1926885 RepID=A0A2P4UIQ6_9ACTN|nr:M23 family metallopeptidase [Actinomadura rubteroloni]POM24916.1 Spore-associated protein A precursor [Actinomadura rubteroloni]
MRRVIRAFAVLAAGVLASAGLAAPAVAAPDFQVPFTCGTVVTAATFSGHNPPYSVDFQKDGITGMPVLASAGGTVTRVADEGSTSYGKWIELDHGGGYRTRYAHLSAQQVSVGQQVSLGQQIGKAGATGNVTGPHLHYEQRLNGTTQKAVLDGRAVPYYGHTDFTSHNACGGNPYTAAEVCGSGYSVIDSYGLTGGRVYLLYASSTARNCVVTLKSSNVGTPSAVSAHLQVEGGTTVTDSGSFAYYAGPVSRAAGGLCVKWGGSVGSSSYTSPFEHCG